MIHARQPRLPHREKNHQKLKDCQNFNKVKKI